MSQVLCIALMIFGLSFNTQCSDEKESKTFCGRYSMSKTQLNEILEKNAKLQAENYRIAKEAMSNKREIHKLGRGN